MKNIIIQSLLLAFPVLLFSQGGLVNEGMNLNLTAGIHLRVEGGGVTNTGGDIDNEGNIYLDSDWAQTGGSSTYIGNGWMWFEGSSNQNISSASPLTVPKLRVDNGNRLLLANDIIVSTDLDLTNNGSIELGANNLVLSSGATISNYDASNFIVTNSTGVLQQEVGATSVFFPIGNSSYNPATVNNTGTIDNFLARVEAQVLTNGTSGTPETQGVVDRSWHITEETVGGSVATLTLQWDVAQELSGFNPALSGVLHWTGTNWDYPPYSATTPVGASFSQTRTGLTSFSPFAVSSNPFNSIEPIGQHSGNIAMYPVPTLNELNINFSDWNAIHADVTIQVVDVLGRILISRNEMIQQNAVVNLHEVRNLLPGTYILVATSQTGLNFVRKFVKNEE
jgi:hypothetical protein